MEGVVTVVKRRGAVVETDSPVDNVVPGAEFTVHRGEALVGTGVVRKLIPPNGFKLNPRYGEMLECQVGDVVRPA